jgi:hypothetical protein
MVSPSFSELQEGVIEGLGLKDKTALSRNEDVQSVIVKLAPNDDGTPARVQKGRFYMRANTPAPAQKALQLFLHEQKPSLTTFGVVWNRECPKRSGQPYEEMAFAWHQGGRRNVRALVVRQSTPLQSSRRGRDFRLSSLVDTPCAASACIFGYV